MPIAHISLIKIVLSGGWMVINIQERVLLRLGMMKLKLGERKLIGGPFSAIKKDLLSTFIFFN